MSKEHLVILGIYSISILIIVAIWAWYAGRIDAIEKDLKKAANEIEIPSEGMQ